MFTLREILKTAYSPKSKGAGAVTGCGSTAERLGLDGDGGFAEKRRGGLPDPGMKKPREGFAGLVVF